VAQGTITVFDEALPRLNFSAAAADATNGICLDADTIKVVLISNDIDTITAAQATPDVGDFTEVAAGGGYSTGGETCTITVSEAGGTLTVALGANVVWTSSGTGGPADIRCAIFHSTTHAGSSDAFAVMDMTTDSGTTPLDLDAGDITINSGNLFTIS
jgi:hypothetical protein